MKKIFISLLVLSSISAFAKEYIYFQSGIINNSLVSVFSNCSSDVDQYTKWHKQLNKLQLFETPTAPDSIVFETSEECNEFVWDAIENREATAMDGISLKAKFKKNQVIHKAVGAFKINGQMNQ